MKHILIISLLLLSTTSFSQARLVFNNGGYMNIENNANLVIDNGNANAVTLLGSGGNILSEAEGNVVKWNVGNVIGNYIIPFTNTNGVKVPVEVNITSAGNSTGSLIFSTYRTNNMNLPRPAGVSNMCAITPTLVPDNSLKVVDRFWIIDNDSYSTKPGATLSFAYDIANEAGGTNNIAPGNLVAQRYNPSAGGNLPECPGGDWEELMFGTANMPSNRVENAAISPSDFFKYWVLTDNTTPLPITLLSFNAECENSRTVLKWSTASESNSDYFVIEKSTDGNHFDAIGTVPGSGNSSEVLNYSYKDNTPNVGTNYYRLKQVDFNGQYEIFNIISSNCSAEDDFAITHTVFGDNSLQFNVQTSTKEELSIALYDYTGQLVATETSLVNKGGNSIKINGLNITKGIYMLYVRGINKQYAIKLFKQ